MLCINNIDIRNKKVLIRVDFNVPIINKKIADVSRVYANIETINYALEQNAAIILISHLGDPDVLSAHDMSKKEQCFSLAIIIPILESILNKQIKFVTNWFDLEKIDVDLGQIVLCENIRFTIKEKQNDLIFSKKLASFADVIIMDAFATAHRKHASVYGILNYAKIAAAGFLLHREVIALEQVLLNPKRPLAAIVGGAKISTKLKVLKSLSKTVDYLIIGGAIANTCLRAKGYNIGISLNDNDFIDLAKQLYDTEFSNIVLPEDVIVLNSQNIVEQKDIESISDTDCILDIGKNTITNYQAIIKQANTILWNGPLGKIDDLRFANGTKCIAETIVLNQCLSIVGGGDTLAIIKQFDLTEFSYISTGGGAFLEFIENHTLPMIELLNKFG